METLIGVLIDVSNVMEQSSQKLKRKPNEDFNDWIKSMFIVVNDLVRNIPPSNHIFALGFGAKEEPVVFDILNTIKHYFCPSTTNGSKKDNLDAILTILENNGFLKLDRSNYINDLEKSVEYEEATIFLEKLIYVQGFAKQYLKLIPPYFLATEQSLVKYKDDREEKFLTYLRETFDPVTLEKLKKNVIHQAVDHAKKLVIKSALVSIEDAAILMVHNAASVLEAFMREEFLPSQKVEELKQTASEYIFGRSHLNSGLESALRLFSHKNYKTHEKLLIIASAGKPSDELDPNLSNQLSSLGVKTVCCYVTENHIQPRRLYSTIQPTWDDSANLMFNMSSSIPTQNIPCTLFLNRNWDIDVEKNETRLFFQVNHPTFIEEVCHFAKEIAFSQEALSDVLSSVSLDLYINQANTEFTPKKQEDGTCYANAAATVMHLSMIRIHGRVGGYPDFFKLREKIIKEFGTKGANTFTVLSKVCPYYRLQCKKIDQSRALKAVVFKQPVIAIFRLTDGEHGEWRKFKEFFDQNKRGVLNTSVLDLSKRPKGIKLKGHAVVLTSFNSKGLRLMNSWGSDWADGGFFMVSDAKVLNLMFIAVFWSVENLEESEKTAIQQLGSDVAKKLISKLPNLHNERYICPVCIEASDIYSFKGNHLKPVCPKCSHRFKASNANDSLALHMYLLSVSHSGSCNQLISVS